MDWRRKNLERVVDEIKETAYNEGYNEGHDRGYNDGYKQATKAGVVEIGTLYIHGVPMPIPEQPTYDGDVIGLNCNNFYIGDTKDSMAIRWLKFGDLLVSDRCLIKSVSWATLNNMGLVEGKKITIDGKRYLIRIPTGGADEDDQDNDWDRLVDLYGEDNDILHYNNIYSWCRDAYSVTRVIRGYDGACSWFCADPSNYGADLGWRPVLEPLNTYK